MNTSNKQQKLKSLSLGVLCGLCTGVLVASLFLFFVWDMPTHEMGDSDMASSSKEEPLYWVAPMDPNFKRDKPGQSPMGMDLVPVYASDSPSDAPGTVSIDPVTIQNLGVKTAKIYKSEPDDSIQALGKVVFAEDQITHIHPRVAGWVEALFVNATGDSIEQGEPIYSLYSPELVNAQEELLIALRQNNAQLIAAAKDRLLALNAPQSLIASIQKDRKITRTITFYALHTGVVKALNIREGFYVEPSTTMLSVASLDNVWVIADIFSLDASKVAIGQVARINSYYNAAHGSAQLQYIYPSVDAITRTVQARFVLSNPEHLFKPNMFVELDIDPFSAPSYAPESVLQVPKQALIRTGKQNRVVLALGDGKFKSIEVEIGRHFTDSIEMVQGLEEGDEVVISAQFLLDSESSISSDFMRMEPAKTEEADTDNISDWTHATVMEVIEETEMLRLKHGPLDAFNMMGMTMNFELADSLELSSFESGMEVHIEVIKAPSGMYQVKTVHFMDKMGEAND